MIDSLDLASWPSLEADWFCPLCVCLRCLLAVFAVHLLHPNGETWSYPTLVNFRDCCAASCLFRGPHGQYGEMLLAPRACRSCGCAYLCDHVSDSRVHRPCVTPACFQLPALTTSRMLVFVCFFFSDTARCAVALVLVRAAAGARLHVLPLRELPRREYRWHPRSDLASFACVPGAPELLARSAFCVQCAAWWRVSCWCRSGCCAASGAARVRAVVHCRSIDRH